MYIEQMESVKIFLVHAIAQALDATVKTDGDEYIIFLRDGDRFHNEVAMNADFQFYFNEYNMKIYMWYDIDRRIVEGYQDFYLRVNTYLLNTFHNHFRGYMEVLGPGNDLQFIDPRQTRDVTMTKQVLRPYVFTYWNLNGDYYFIEDFQYIKGISNDLLVNPFNFLKTNDLVNRIGDINKRYNKFLDNSTIPAAFAEYATLMNDKLGCTFHKAEDDHIFKGAIQIDVNKKEESYPWEQ